MRFNLEAKTKAQQPQSKKQRKIRSISGDHSSLYVSTSVVFSVLATPPHNLEILGFVALAGLIKASVEAPDRKRAFAYGLIYGALSTWAMNLWVLNLSVVGWLAACWVGIFPAIFCTLINKSKLSTLSPIWWSSCWVLIEAIRTALIPFGWNPISSMTSNIYLIQNAAWGSGYIISFALCLSSATVALTLMNANLRSKISSLVISVLALTILLYLGHNRLRNIESLPKEDIEQIPMTIMSSKEPFTATLEGRWTILENHIRRTKEANSPYLNVWPESIGFALLSHQPSWDAIVTLANEVPGPLLLTPSYPYGNKIYNSSILLENQATEAQIYKKRFLTPIGEYIPSFVPKSLVYSQRHPGDQSGDLTMLVTDNAGTRPYRVGMLICLEETISEAAKQSLAQGAEIFISPSNHGDTGRDCALQQERMGQLRAIETCTSLVRIGNIGASNIFDFSGREIFRNEGEKMSNIQVPILKNKSDIFPNIYLKTQEAMLWILILIFAIGLFGNIARKKS
jgi:apolipoprotein N-acyltransferase